MVRTVINKPFIDIDFEGHDIKFVIESNQPLDEQTIQEIENIHLSIYWNDAESAYWSFDTKLNCGKWLENIFYCDGLREAKALILN